MRRENISACKAQAAKRGALNALIFMKPLPLIRLTLRKENGEF